MTQEALLIIDYTNDFVSDKGSLTCGKPAQELENEIVNLADSFLKQNKWVIIPTDLHFPGNKYHPETKLFPPHNLPNTWGRHYMASCKLGMMPTKQMIMSSSWIKRAILLLQALT